MMNLLASLEATGFASWLRESGSIWGYPTVLTLHTLGLGVLVGASTVIYWGRMLPFVGNAF
jgi:hypothetical protein